MKKIILLLAVFSFALYGCPDSKSSATSYQVVNNSAKEVNAIKELDGSIYEVIIFCFKDEDVVREDTYYKLAYGGEKTEVKEVPEGTNRIKVSFKFLPKSSDYYDSPSNVRYYTVSYSTLEKDKNTLVEINGSTMLQKTLKSDSPAQKGFETNENWIEFNDALKSNLILK